MPNIQEENQNQVVQSKKDNKVKINMYSFNKTFYGGNRVQTSYRGEKPSNNTYGNINNNDLSITSTQNHTIMHTQPNVNINNSGYSSSLSNHNHLSRALNRAVNLDSTIGNDKSDSKDLNDET